MIDIKPLHIKAGSVLKRGVRTYNVLDVRIQYDVIVNELVAVAVLHDPHIAHIPGVEHTFYMTLEQLKTSLVDLTQVTWTVRVNGEKYGDALYTRRDAEDVVSSLDLRSDQLGRAEKTIVEGAL